MVAAASTRSPLLKSFTPSPISRTVPASSKPGGNGSGALNWYFPWVSNTSGKLTPAAATSISTSPAPGFGASTSSTRRSSIPVRLRQRSAFMQIGSRPIVAIATPGMTSWSKFPQGVLYAIPQFDQPRAQVGDDPGARHLVHLAEAAEGHDLAAVARRERHAHRERIRVPVAEREAEAVFLVIAHRLLEAVAHARPLGLLHDGAIRRHRLRAIVARERGEAGAPEGGRAARHALAHLEPQAEERIAVADLEEHHVHVVSGGERDRGLAMVGEALHQRAGDLAHVEAREVALPQGEHADAERVLLLLGEELEIAEPGERVGDARDGRLGQPRALRDLLVAERPVAPLERAQDGERARDRGDEVAVALVVVVRSLHHPLLDHLGDFEQAGRALPTADAHGRDHVLHPAALAFDQRMPDHTRSRGA